MGGNRYPRPRLRILFAALFLLLYLCLPAALSYEREFEDAEPAPRSWISDHLEVLFALSSLSIVLWYAGSWFFCARDQRRRSTYPIFHVPYGLEPAYVGYIKKLSFDPDLFLADLTDLAVSGFAVISPLDGALSVSRTQKRWNDLSPAHRAMMDSLFEGGKPSVLICGRDGAGSAADAAFTKAKVSRMPFFYGVNRRLKARKNTSKKKLPALVKWNAIAVLCGLPLFVPFFLLLETFCEFRGGISFGLFPIALATLFFIPFFTSAVSTVKKLKRSRHARATAGGLSGRHHRDEESLASAVAVAAMLALLSLAAPFFIISRLLAIFFTDLTGTGPYVVTCAGAAIASALVFSVITPARTQEGKKLLSRVEGFEMFLKTANLNRMERLYPFRGQKIPEPSLELFERFLPYAIALNAAGVWAESFAAMIADSGYSPSWYGGVFDASVFCEEMSRLSRSISDSPNVRRERLGKRR
ncbi:MAG: DUF2207 domain-containing protein [Synergistaceae bacterium]|jgi:hypothetical protein|nr:DUF2207 domain-containing protein [Synergistaceae bacterium]